jgi:hypothetical protein
MSQDRSSALRAPVSAGAESPTGDFEFLADPLSLLTDDQQRDLREDLAELTRLRREVESEAASLRLT